MGQPFSKWMLVALSISLLSPADGALRAFVSNEGSNTVTEIDVASNTVVGTHVVQSAPVGIAADTVNGYVYTANSTSQSISRIDLATGIVTNLSLPGSIPEGIAVSASGALVLMGSHESVPQTGGGSKSRVYIIDGATLSVITSVFVEDDPEGIAISEDEHQAWTASDERIEEIELHDTATLWNVSTVINGTELVDDYEHVAVRADKAILFATNDLQSRLEVIDLSTETITASVATGNQPENVMIRPGTDEVFVTCQGDPTVTILSQTTFAVLGSVSLSSAGGKGIAFTPDGATGYVAVPSASAVLYFDAATRTQLGSIAVSDLPEEIVIFETGIATAVANWEVYQ